MKHNQHIINAFTELGSFLSQFNRESIQQKESVKHNELFFDALKHQITIAEEHNGWFTKDNVLFALESWTTALTKENIEKWLNNYELKNIQPKKVAVIMAGNIPMVGFHDFLSVLICDHNVLVKQSSNDKHLLPIIAKYLEYVEPSLKGKIEFTEEKLDGFDAVIATGSDNTARYFEYYFKNKPSIIRKNRNSVAVITGNETKEELKALSNDIFRYFGLGCRNVSKLFVPDGYDFNNLFEAIYDWHPVINIAKYANNYDYNKAVYLMSEFDMLENGFLMIKEDQSYSSPIATLFFEYYTNKEQLQNKLNTDKELIQCVVSNNLSKNNIAFGETQTPKLWDYADGVDTVEFLLKI